MLHPEAPNSNVKEEPLIFHLVRNHAPLHPLIFFVSKGVTDEHLHLCFWYGMVTPRITRGSLLTHKMCSLLVIRAS
jgi:hypothetical protein